MINIFEQVLTAALGCSLANRSVVKLDISAEEVQHLHYELSEYDDCSLSLRLRKAAGKVLEELNADSLPLRRYIEKSLSKIITNILHAVRMNTLDKTFISKALPDLKPRIRFLSGTKMHDEDYRKLIDELLICRHSSDKLVLIKEKVKSFGDLEDLLLDAHLSEEETALVFDILGDVEIAVLVRRHPFKTDIQALDLSEGEMALRQYLKNYIDRLPKCKQE